MVETVWTSLILGLLAAGSPCVFPLYPGFLAYLSGGPDRPGWRGRHFLGFFVLAGVMAMMLALGLIIVLLSISIGRALAILIPLADLLIVSLGALLIFNINLFKRLPIIQAPIFANPFANAFIYGLLYGPIALPCSGPLVVGIFALSFTAGEVIERLAVFIWFGIGFGLPLLGLSFLAGASARWISRQFAVHSQKINLASGLLLVTVGIYDLLQNWPLIMTYLGA